MPRRMILLTDGFRDAHTAKTAVNLLRYRPDEVAAVLDREAAGHTAQEILGLGGTIPVVARLRDAPHADTLVLGIAPPGGKIPPPWRAVILEAIALGMTVVSGLHDFLCDDPEFLRAAKQSGARLVDVRNSNEHEVASRKGIRDDCLRIHTVGNDCSVGKMVAAVEIAAGLQRRGVRAKFVATGQTGMLIEGDGCCVDRVISDFVAGAAEKLVRGAQEHEVMVIEGQGSLFHPRYSCVTLGLLHGTIPHGLILCYEMGRTRIAGMEEYPLPTLEKVREFYESAANLMHPCRVIGVAVNGHRFSDEEVANECRQVSKRLALPACDVLRHGPEKLIHAVLELRRIAMGEDDG